jgi:octaprenyl-diphosphate synthase
MNLKDITKPIKEHLNEFNTYFNKQLQTKVSLLNIILKYITAKKGKQVRPVMVFLSAEICGGVNNRSYIAASLVELLHTATLIHDDVVDEASERRGIASINAKWNNKIAVLIGDYLLSQGLLIAVDNNEFQFLHVTSKAVKRMSEGELLSIDKSRSVDIDEETYFSIISDKTASLLSTCCEIGAISSTDDIEKQTALKNYGEYVGIAFQIRDDIFDYMSRSALIGKPVGNDLKEKKITLPLLYALKNNPGKDADKSVKLVKRGKLKKSEIESIIDFVVNSGGIAYSEQKALEYSNQAKNLLEIFPDSEAKRSLINFADFVLDRKS